MDDEFYIYLYPEKLNKGINVKRGKLGKPQEQQQQYNYKKKRRRRKIVKNDRYGLFYYFFLYIKTIHFIF